MVAFSVPMPGTSSSSTSFPVGNIAPPAPSSSAAGSMNSSCTSAAGKVTPSSSKSPRLLHLAVGDRHVGDDGLADVGLPDAHHGHAVARNARRIDQAAADGKRPTAADRLPQLPLQSTKAVDGDLAEQVVDIVVRPAAGAGSPSCWCWRWRRPCRRSACRTGPDCRSRAAAGVARGARHAVPLRASPAGERTRPCWCRRAYRWRGF
jgi:hypothetical protein